MPRPRVLRDDAEAQAYRQALATELRFMRRTLGLTQAHLAQLVLVHPITVSKWERGLIERQGSLGVHVRRALAMLLTSPAVRPRLDGHASELRVLREHVGLPAQPQPGRVRAPRRRRPTGAPAAPAAAPPGGLLAP